MKEENGNSTLDTDKLRRMGFNFPEKAFQIIEVVERGDDLKTIKGELITSFLVGKLNGHLLLSIVLFNESDFFFEGERICAPSKTDLMLVIDRKWVTSRESEYLRKVYESIEAGKTLDDAILIAEQSKGIMLLRS